MSFISVKEKLQSLYASIADRIILMALESVDYCEDKAIQILNIVVADTQKVADVGDEEKKAQSPSIKKRWDEKFREISMQFYFRAAALFHLSHSLDSVCCKYRAVLGVYSTRNSVWFCFWKSCSEFTLWCFCSVFIFMYKNYCISIHHHNTTTSTWLTQWNRRHTFH